MSTELTINSIALRESLLAWHVLYTRHQHERTVNQILTNKGLESFLPLCPSLSQWKDRTKRVYRPLFPCYVFVRVARTDWLDVLKTPGVQMMVPCGDEPALVPEEEINAVRRLIEVSEIVEPHPFLNTGDRVRVKSGPLSGVEGFLIRKKSLYRLVVCIEILGKAASAEIDAALVERAADRNRREPNYHAGFGASAKKAFGPSAQIDKSNNQRASLHVGGDREHTLEV